MSTDVLRLTGDYKVQTSDGGIITLDTGISTGTVVITGNLDVRGNQTTVESNNTKIKDNEIILNDGETNGYVTLGKAGIVIDRGNNASSTSAAYLSYNDTAYWQTPGTTSRGIWEFKVGNKFSAIKVNAIRFDGLGADLDGRLNLLGPSVTGMLSVAGQSNYAARVTDPDDIPNKEYVDNVPFKGTATNAVEARRLRVGNTFIQIDDFTETGETSQIRMDIDNEQTVLVQPDTVVLAGIAITSSTVRATTTNTDLILLTNGTGNIIANSAISYQVPYVVPSYTQNQVKVYSTSTPGAGASGLLYVNNLGRDELTGARRAMVFSLIL